MQKLLVFITFISVTAFSNPHDSKEGLKSNLSASADSVEESLRSGESDERKLEELQIAEIKFTLKEINEI